MEDKGETKFTLSCRKSLFPEQGSLRMKICSLKNRNRALFEEQQEAIVQSVTLSDRSTEETKELYNFNIFPIKLTPR